MEEREKYRTFLEMSVGGENYRTFLEMRGGEANIRPFLEMRGGEAKLQTISGYEWRRGKSTEHSWN